MTFEEVTAKLFSWADPSLTDLSSAVLADIFGAKWWDIGSFGDTGVFSLFLVVHAICASVIAWLMIIRLFSQTLGAAQDMKGTRFSAWVPLRLCFSMAAITPLAHGICVAHIALASVIGVSITMANSVVDTAFSIMQEKSTLSPYTGGDGGYSILTNSLDVGESQTGGGKSGGKALAVQILQNEAFLHYLHTQLGCNVPFRNFSDKLFEEVDPKGNHILYFSEDGHMECYRGYVKKSRASYGAFVIAKNDENDVVIPVPIEERVALLKDLITAVERTNAPAHFSVATMQGREIASVLADRNAVHAAGIAYAQKLAKVCKGLGTRSQELTDRLNAFVAQNKSLGWLALGSHYWTYATLEQELMESDSVQVSWIEPKYRNFAEILPTSFMTSFWPRINEASYLGESPDASMSGKILAAIAPFTGITKRFANALSEQPDALLAMVKVARWISGTCTSILVASEAAKLAALGGSKIITKNIMGRVGDFFTGSGEAIDTTVQALVADVSFFLRLLLLPLWCFSTFVAYFVPAIPFLFWLIALCGWLCMVLEAFVATPLWLIGIALPEGDGFAGKYGRQGYILLLQLFLRPTLLVISIFLCFLAMRATGHVFGALAAPFIDAQAGLSSFTLGIVGCIALFIVLVGGVSLVTWKLFSLITYLPDRVFRWMGAEGGSFHTDFHATYQAFQTTTNTTAHAGSRVVSNRYPKDPANRVLKTGKA